MLNEYLLFFQRPCPGDVSSLMKACQSLLGEKRFLHVQGVHRAALNFAELFKLSTADSGRLGLAVWLHDFVKGLDISSQITLAQRLGIPLSEETQKAPSVIHGVIGAWLAPNVFKINDASIEEAVFHHTTGHPELDMIGKFLFLADYCEEGRSFDSTHITSLLPHHLDQALLLTIKEKIVHVINKNQYLHSASLLFYYSLLSVPR